MPSPETQRLLDKLADIAIEAEKLLKPNPRLQRAISYLEGLAGRPMSHPETDAQKKARAWLVELEREIHVMGATDYRTHDYRLSVDRVLALCKSDYVRNALTALDERER